MASITIPEPLISQDDTPPSGITRVVPVTLASFNRRFWAYIVDSVILGCVVWLLSLLITPTTALWWDYLVNLAILTLSQGYYLIAYSTTGQTPGKYLLGIKVIATDGTPLNWRTGMLRVGGAFLSIWSLSLGYLWARWNKKRQTWHDKIAKTCVVLATDRMSPNAAIEVEQDDTPIRQFLRYVLITLYLLWLVGSVFYMMPPVQYVLANGIYSVQGVLLGQDTLMYGEEYMTLLAALGERWNPDDAIPAATVGFDISTVGDVSETWLVIEIEYTPECTANAKDPCDQVADELAAIVLDHYAKVDDLEGVSVQIVNQRFVKQMTVTEWREELDR